MWLPSTLAYALALAVAAFVPFRWELLERLPRVGVHLAANPDLAFIISVAVSLTGYVVIMHALWLLGGAVDYVFEQPALSGRAEAGPFGRWFMGLQQGRQMGLVLFLVASIAILTVAVSIARGQPDGPQFVLAGATLVSAIYTRRPFSFAYDVVPRLVKAPLEFARWSQGNGMPLARRPLASPRARVAPTPPEVLDAQLRTTFGDTFLSENADIDLPVEGESDESSDCGGDGPEIEEQPDAQEDEA